MVGGRECSERIRRGRHERSRAKSREGSPPSAQSAVDPRRSGSRSQVTQRIEVVISFIFLLCLPIQAEIPEVPWTIQFASQFKNLVPPYALSTNSYLNVEIAYAPLRYLPGKSLSLLNWEAVLIGLDIPAPVTSVEAQLYAGAGLHHVFGQGSVGEMGLTFNDRRGAHINFLTRNTILQEESGYGKLRLTSHAQLAVPSWGLLGFSSLTVMPRWEMPCFEGRALTHLAYIWNGADRTGLDQDDEWYAGAGFRYPDKAPFSAMLAVGGYSTPTVSKLYLSPSLIWSTYSISVQAGVSIDLSPSGVHTVHIGLHDFGEPK